MSLVKVIFLVYVVSVLASGSTTDSSIIHATLELTNCEEKGTKTTLIYWWIHMNLNHSDFLCILTICRYTCTMNPQSDKLAVSLIAKLVDHSGGGVLPTFQNSFPINFMTKICRLPYPIFDHTKNLIPYLRLLQLTVALNIIFAGFLFMVFLIIMMKKWLLQDNIRN